ncbi:MAG: amino acid adenylation domain-containing protein [Nostoc sp. TH1S01]|nr:amino acid adenylation domain-containing protein [Nostoc sp. TH1S01]
MTTYFRDFSAEITATQKQQSLTEKELHQLLVEWNDTKVDYPNNVCIHQLFEAQVERTPDAIALLFEGKELTYRELNQQANQLAHHLKYLGIRPGMFVAVCMNRSLEMIPSLLGILKAGGAYVPLEPSFPKARLQEILSSLKTPCMITQSALLTTFQDILQQLPALEHIICLNTSQQSDSINIEEAKELSVCQQIWMHLDLIQSPKHNLPAQADQDDLAYVIFTSGSTGTPKGVMVRHKPVTNLIDWVNKTFDINSSDRILFITSLCFDLSVYDIFGILAAGASIRIVSDTDVRDPERLLSMLNDEPITFWDSAPAALQQLIPFFPFMRSTEKKCQLRLVFLSGDWIPVKLPDIVRQTFPGVEIVSLGGATEATVWSNYYRIGYVDPHWVSIPYGKPIQNAQYYILNSQLQPCPIGVSGDLYISGDCLSSGYINEPTLTTERFISNPFSDEPNSRLYKTGDVARYMPDGNIEFLGRIDNQVKIHGFRIELGEIEVVLNTHPQIQQAVVIAREDIPGNKRLVAYVVSEQNNQSDAANSLELLQIQQWQEVYDVIYDESVEIEQSSYNTVGWKSSYTGEQISQEQMRQWADSTVEQILKWQPQHVLEIGCGTGMLLFQIAPHCLSYCGTDLSAASLGYVERQIKHSEESYSHVSLNQKLAHDFTDYEEGRFDAVIINSVVQHFPSIDYLIEVLQGAVNTLAEGGFIFVGDIRSLSLLETFHTATKFYRASDSLTIDQLRQQVKNAVNQETELVISPSFFLALKQHLPQIKYVQIQLKPGDYHNELTKFRYDVIIHVGNSVCSTVTPEWLDFKKDGLNLSAIKQLLVDKKPESVGIKHIPNARLHEEMTLLKELSKSDGRETIGQLRNTLQLQKKLGVEPDELWSLNDELPYAVYITWSGTGDNGCYDAIFIRNESVCGSQRIFPNLEVTNDVRGWSAYANNPSKQKWNRHLVSQLPSFLKQKLPYYMVPNAFVTLDTLPLTPNGKVDRRALPRPDMTRPELAAIYVEPRTYVEKMLAEIWAQALRLEQVGIYDNFFELGGNSILSIQIITNCHKAGLLISPAQMFQHPTVAELAALVGTTTAVQTKESLLTIPSTFSIAQQTQEDLLLPTIVSASEERHLPFPLTDIQQAYWVGESRGFELGNIRAHVYVEFESVDLDLKQCNFALQRLIERHEMLRMIVLPNGQQKILEQVPIYEIEVLDLREKDPQTVVSQLESVRQRMSHQGPSTDEWPLFEVLAHCLEDQRVRLHISISLLVMDGRAATVLTQELLQLYYNLNTCFAPLDLSFRDYVLALTKFQKSETYQRSLNYWKNRLLTLPSAPELPLAKNIVAVSNPQFVRRSMRLEPQTWLRLKARATRVGLTPTVMLCTAYNEVISAWSKISHFTLNILFFNRLPLNPQVNDIVGNFSSTILLEVNNTAETSFETRAKQLQQQLWTDLEYSHDVSGVQVLQELNRIEGKTSRAAMPVVFASTLNLNSLDEENSFIPLPGKVIYSSLQTPQVLLDHQVYEQNETLLFNWDAVEEVFPEGLLDDMFNAYCRLLHYLADEETAWQETVLPLIPSAQLQQRRVINATEAPVPAEMLHTLFAAQVPQRPHQAAVISSNQTLTYEELSCRANQLAHKLHQLGSRPNVLVAVVMEKGWEQVVAVLGVLQSGAAYLAIDPTVPKERLWYLLDQSEIGLVLTQSRIDENLEWPNSVQRLCVNHEDLKKADSQPLDTIHRPEDLAYVIFTSGSTGLPKGVMIDHRGAVNTICDINQRFGIGSEDRVLALSSLNFDLSVYDIFGTLAAGGTIIIPDASSVKDTAHWMELLVREKVTIWNSVPALMQMFVEHAADRPEMLPHSLRLVLLSGDWISVVLPNQIKTLFGDVQVVSLGGATEASIWSILYPIEDVDPAWNSLPYGKPMLNQCVYVLNKALKTCPTWVVGDLYISGMGLAKGYWRDEEKTNAHFINHPKTGERLYRTGDVGRYLPDGNIEFLGREDFQVKIQGYRIELGEIEAALEQHPAVCNAVATAVEDLHSNKRLVVYAVVNQAQAPNISELRSFLAEKLPDYMVPSAFVLLNALPLTPNGKVDRKTLPSPDLTVPERQKSFVVPRDSLELQITQLWQDLLNVHPVGVRDNFFNLGGNSLQAIRLMSKLQKLFKQELSLSTLLQGPTIEHLASVLRHQTAPMPQSSLVAIQPIGSKRPFFCVHPVGGNVLCYVDLANHLGLDQPFYGLQSLGLDGKRQPYTQIEDMAIHYIEALRTIQPEGPYLLGGWSMGGIVAFEMAQQLRKQNQEVASLVLLDSRMPTGTPNLDDAMLLSWFVRDLGGRFAKTLTVPYNQPQKLGSDEGLHYIIEEAIKANILPPDVSLTQVQRLLNIFKANTRSMWSYKAKVYPNRITFFQPNDIFSEDFANFYDHTSGWSKFISEQIEINNVPGNHYTMLLKPHVTFLAEKLRHCFDQVS